MSVGAVNKSTGDRIPTAGMPAIDDALDLTSVNPVQNAVITAALANKQDKTDNNLETTSKTVVGAVNELKSGLMNKSIICDILVSVINSTPGSWNLGIALNTDKKLSDYDLFVFNRYKSGSTYPAGVSYLVTKGQLTSSSGGYPIKLIDGSGDADSFYVGRADDTHISAYMGTSIDSNTVFCLYGIKLSQ